MDAIPRIYLERYSALLNSLSNGMKSRLMEQLRKIDYSDVTAARVAAVAVMDAACTASTDAAAAIAAEFYDGLREIQTGMRMGALAESGREPKATEGAVRAFVQDLVDGRPVEQFTGKCADRLDYETRRAANECTVRNAKRDPMRPKWARVPTGAETCRFCIMLASRGFVYRSEDSASHAHANCDCRVVPSWDKENPLLEGYDPDYYYDVWKHPERHTNTEEDSKRSARSDREERYDEYLAARDKRSEIYNGFWQEKDMDRKDQLRAELSKADKAISAARDKLTNGEFMFLSARLYPINEYVKPEKWHKTPSTNEIIKMIGGGDKTDGSCSSLAFAYFANKGGSVVRDFRGGSSCDFFALNGRIKEMTTIDGVESFTTTHRSAFTAAEMALKHVEDGKRYYFSVGEHAAVIEKRDDSIYYLELQSQTDNGWYKLTNKSLKQRFGCKKTTSISGIKLDQDAILIDGDTLSSNSEFLELMGYINTPESEQKKGVDGHVK